MIIAKFFVFFLANVFHLLQSDVDFKCISKTDVICSNAEKYEEKAFIDKNCRCDKLCKFYNDCCHKKIFENSLLNLVKCIRDERLNTPEADHSFYMVDSCPMDYDKNDKIKAACETKLLRKGHGGRDILPINGWIDITKSNFKKKKLKRLQVVFRNIYCAVCNSAKELSAWSLNLQCQGVIGQRLYNKLFLPSNILNEIPLTTIHDLIKNPSCRQTFIQPPTDSAGRYCKTVFASEACQADSELKKKMKPNCEKQEARIVYINNRRYFTAFRNEFCVQCQGVNNTYITCTDPRTDSINKLPHDNILLESGLKFSMDSLKLTVSMEFYENGKRKNIINAKLANCRKDTIYDTIENRCINFCQNDNQLNYVGGDNHRWNIGFCQNATFMPSRRDIVLETDKKSTKNENVDNDDCPPDSRRKILDETDYQLKSDGLYVKNYGLIDAYRREESGHLSICQQTTMDVGKRLEAFNETAFTFNFDKTVYIVCLIATSMSIIGLTILLGIYSIVGKLRNVEGKCLMSLCSALFLAQVLLLIGTKRTEVHYICVGLAALLHYSILVVFFWTNCLFVNVVRSLKTSSSLNGGENYRRQGRRFVIYSLYSWILPFFIVCAALLIDLAGFYQHYRPIYAREECWITSQKGLLIWFILPASYCIVVDLALLTRAACMLCVYSIQNDGRRLLTIYSLFIFLLSICWITASVWAFTGNSQLAYAFVLANGSLGVFLCTVVVCARRIFVSLVTKDRIDRDEFDSNGYYNIRRRNDRFIISDPTKQYIYDESKITGTANETCI